MNKNWILFGTIIGIIIVNAMRDEVRSKQREDEKLLIDSTTKPLVDEFIKDLETKNNVPNGLRLVK